MSRKLVASQVIFIKKECMSDDVKNQYVSKYLECRKYKDHCHVAVKCCNKIFIFCVSFEFLPAHYEYKYYNMLLN